MSKIRTEIANLESILTNHQGDHTEDELAEMTEDLRQFTYLANLWDQFSAIPMGADSRLLKTEFHPIGYDGKPSCSERVFPAGTPEAAVLSWFETRFCLSVHEEFDYDGPWDGGTSCDGCRNAAGLEKGTIRTKCLACRRQYPGQEAFQHKSDLYQPVRKAAPTVPVVTAKPTPQCDIQVTLEAPLAVTVSLSENDITHWMDQCSDQDVLKRLARYANYCVQSLNAEPDDFRSRA